MTEKSRQTVRVAVTQLEPCWFNKTAAVAKTIECIAKASENGAKLIAFPELWLPGYPAWIWYHPVHPPYMKAYMENSITRDGPEMQQIVAASGKYKISVVLGYSERHEGSLYITQTLIDCGVVILHHRKLRATHMERTIFGEASGNDLLNVETTASTNSRIGMLNCWEHLQPLLKYHTMSLNEEIHVAGWPPLFPAPSDGSGLWSMSSDGAHSASRMYAVEGQCFSLCSTAVMSQLALDAHGVTEPGGLMGNIGGGQSRIFAPDGSLVPAEYLEPDQEGLVYADLDMSRVHAAKSFCDIFGHYSRPDLFTLKVNTAKKNNVEYV